MCKQPIRVKNPSRMYLDGVSDMFLKVPCGHCKDCLKATQDDWFVRAMFEYKRCKALGGSCWFPTLSYNNDNLPWFRDEEFGFNAPVFNRDHIKKFRDKLRVYLKRKGFDSKGIRYIIVPEYGGKRGRSHLHALLFVPFFVPTCVMVDCIKRAWIYGFVMRSKNGWIIENIRGVQYAMKYTSKLQYWSLCYNIPEYEQKLKDLINQSEFTGNLDAFNFYSDKLRNFRRVCPRHQQSIYFGLDGLDYFKKNGEYDLDKLSTYSIDMKKCGIMTLKKDVFIMPRYYFNKIFTNIDCEGVRHKNKLYEDTLIKRFNDSLNNRVESIKVYFQSPMFVQTHLAPLGFKLDKVSKICKGLEFLKGSNSFGQIALFDMVYRDMPINKTIFNFDGMSQKDIKTYLLDNAQDFMISKKMVDIPPANQNESLSLVSPELFSMDRPNFNDLPCFSKFVKLLDKIDGFERQLSKLTESQFRKDEIARSKMDKTLFLVED